MEALVPHLLGEGGGHLEVPGGFVEPIGSEGPAPVGEDPVEGLCISPVEVEDDSRSADHDDVFAVLDLEPAGDP